MIVAEIRQACATIRKAMVRQPPIPAKPTTTSHHSQAGSRSCLVLDATTPPLASTQVQITELSANTGDAQAFNQMTRWVMTKEEHCTKIMTLIADYCLAQRCKVRVAVENSPTNVWPTSKSEYHL